VAHLSSATIIQTEPEPSNRQDQQIPDDALRLRSCRYRRSMLCTAS
jgi:hypothetical protein